ncbi:hypothetical protein BGZ99_001679 [Dissophora globulifera]|uniref:Uncharacterized protein n=1 Tax=Dissophora globulifera TaxID=979702 RepID=A0A9P6UXN8_9FUNG|nr:hypothetical protein BGZ99_001679 [Dissophora globulifera]
MGGSVGRKRDFKSMVVTGFGLVDADGGFPWKERSSHAQGTQKRLPVDDIQPRSGPTQRSKKHKAKEEDELN